MDLLSSINEALKYIESNIKNNITYHDAAKHIHMSSYHFHRIFKVFTGITPNEYIRNRILTIACEDILCSEESILNIALKYGYDTQEGFQKAFYRFHGVNPQVAKKSNVELRTYYPLKINISFEGGESMDYKIVELGGFSLLMTTKHFNIIETGKDDSTEIPDFWTKSIREGVVEDLHKYSVDQKTYGACTNVKDDNDIFKYGIGVRVAEVNNTNNYEIWNAKANKWAVFKANSPENIGEVWDKILKEFLVNSNYERVDEIDFELYGEDVSSFCEIWIPVKLKENQL